MIKRLSCIFCNHKTEICIRSIRAKHKESIILLKNAPVYFCPKCKEVIMPLEIIHTMRFIRSIQLKPGINEFDFEATYKQSLENA